MIDFTEWNTEWSRHKNGEPKPGWRWAFRSDTRLGVFAVAFAVVAREYPNPDIPGFTAAVISMGVGFGAAFLMLSRMTNPGATKPADRIGRK